MSSFLGFLDPALSLPEPKPQAIRHGATAKVRAYLETHPGWWTHQQIAAALRLPERQVSSAMASLVKRGEAIKQSTMNTGSQIQRYQGRQHGRPA